MSLYILDTDHISLFQFEHPQVTSKVKTTQRELIATTIITLEEQLSGRLNRIRRARSSSALTLAYRQLRLTWEFFNTINLLDFTTSAENHYKQLISQRIRTGTQDLKIASITLSLNAVLVTRNHKDFCKVPNLVIEDWSLK